jgi:hypothetical protein
MQRTAARQVMIAGAMALLGAGAAGSAQTKGWPPVDKAYVDDKGRVHIVEEDGKDIAVPNEKDQVGNSDVKIAEDKKTVGWMAVYDIEGLTTYPIPLGVVIWKEGKVRQNLGDNLMIYGWRFWEGGKQAAFCSGPVHGDDAVHCELHDAITGRKIAEVAGNPDDKSPEWARGLGPD